MSPDTNGLSKTDNPEVWTVQKIINWSAGWLKDKSVDKDLANPRLEVELLLAHVLACDRMKLYMQLDKPLQKSERDTFKGLLKRRVDGEPVAYVLGYRDFFRHRFLVTRAVLVPRPDTEILVEKCLELLKDVPTPHILEVGTGSGCIAISLAMAKENAKIIAIDKSSPAVEVANKNAELIGTKNLQISVKDIFESDFSEKFDLIVSNPPYIARSEADTLSVSVKNFEPAIALFDDESDGLGFYRLLAKRAKSWLKADGRLAVECGQSQAQAISEIFAESGLVKVEKTKDLAGINRVVSGRIAD